MTRIFECWECFKKCMAKLIAFWKRGRKAAHHHLLPNSYTLVIRWLRVLTKKILWKAGGFALMCSFIAFAWKPKRFAIARVLLLVTLPVVSRISKPAIPDISDLVITWKVMFVVTPSFRQKTDSAILKNNSSIRWGFSLEKSCLLSCLV